MDKKTLKTFAQSTRRVLLQKSIDSEVAYNIFFDYVFLKVLTQNNIIKTENESYDEIKKRCKELFPYYFSNSSLNLTDLIDITLPESEYQNIEALGWLFQYFQSETKEKAKEGESKKFADKNVPITTQVFTPKWICEYMLNNTLGKILGYKNLNYYIENENDTIMKIENLKVLDPCMGTGNILIYAFELLMKKYIDLGYETSKAAELIIYNNLYGFEIDEKAYKVALFSLQTLCMKYGFKNINKERIHIYLINNQLGSLINESYIGLDNKIQSALLDKYDVVCTNPPYMGKKNLNKEVSTYLEQKFPLGKSELYAAFILRCLELAKDSGYVSMITIHSWMFISSFEKLRNYIIDNYYLQSMIHTGANTFMDLNGFNALATSFIIKKESYNKRLTTFIRLANYYDYETKKKEFYNLSNYYYVDVIKFKAIPGVVFDYYVNQKIINLFKNKKIKDLYELRQGLATGNNKKYVHYWYEVEKDKIKFDCKSLEEALKSNYLYFPYNKGGNFSKWYVSCENVIRFDEQSFEELCNQGNKLPSRKYYFQKGITWSLFGFENFAVKYKDYGYIFDVSGSTLFIEDKYLYYVLGYLASNLCFYMLSLLAPTVNFQVGNIGNLPMIINDNYLQTINKLVQENIRMCKENWDNQDISWDFKESPYIKYGKSSLLEENYKLYEINQNKLYNKLKGNEEELNSIYNKIYDIDFISNKVISRDLTIKPLDEVKEIKNLLNYLIGIVLGRYKIDGYNSYDFIELSLLKDEIRLVLQKLFGENNLEENYRYLNKLDLNKYLFNDYKHGIIDYLNKRFKKNPIYYIININNKHYIFNTNRLKQTIDNLYKSHNIVFGEDDSVEVKLEKLNKFSKMYIKK